jgi:y4mF family transcriptional regulator
MRARSPKDIGLIIRDRRRGLGLDQATLAKRIGVSRQWVVEIERGKPRAEVGLVLRALGALGIRLDATVGGDDDTLDAIVERARGGA